MRPYDSEIDEKMRTYTTNEQNAIVVWRKTEPWRMTLCPRWIVGMPVYRYHRIRGWSVIAAARRSPFLLRARRVVGIVLKASLRSNGGPVYAVACHVPALSACQRSASTNPRRSSNLDWSLRRRRILQPRSLRLRRVCVVLVLLLALLLLLARVVVLPGCYPTWQEPTRGVCEQDRKSVGSQRGDSTVRGANGEIFGSPEDRWWGEDLAASFSLFLLCCRFLLCNLLAATSPRSSLPLAVSARGQRAHAPPSAYTLVPSKEGRRGGSPRDATAAFCLIADRFDLFAISRFSLR